MTYKLGSLFDGSGGFPLAGSLCGVEPVWAAEVEPYPIAVTRSRFPSMKHLGDISKINGGEIEPVDIITFGSPCQDLSVAGKRAGLKHEANGDEETTRSGLFMEAVRIIKEMREKTNGRYPTFALWENVPGAFSSNKGEDFRIVCEELIKIVEPSAFMPPVPKNGWSYADSYIGNGWSLAYRVFDAQYWGVPQRRRRIHLVLDLRGERAREVLFEREGVRGYFAEGRTPWQAAPGDAQSGIGADDRAGDGVGIIGEPLGFDPQASRDVGQYIHEDLANTLVNGTNPGWHNGVAYTLKIRSGCEGGGKGALIQTNKSATLATNNDQYLFQPIAFSQNQRDEVRDLGGKSGALMAEPGMKQQTYVAIPNLLLDDQGGQQINVRTDDKCPTLRAEAHGNVPAVMAYSIENHPADSRVNIDDSGKVQTLTSRMGTGGGNVPMVMEAVPTAYSFDSLASNSMKSSNPHSGCRQVDVSKCLDTTDPNPSKNQGGIAIVEQHLMDAYQHHGWRENTICGTLTAGQNDTVRGDTPLVCEAQPVYCLQGNGIDRADTAGCNGKGWTEDVSYTLNTIDRPAVAYLASGKETIGTLMANAGTKLWLGNQEAFSGDYHIIEEQKTPVVRYIVRRLTPTECARLQGFADRWGDIDGKEDFTDEEYRFWLDVRNIHATVIGGKEAKEYTKAQMLTWYNKLHTDSAEYKLWGNGIALPPALYCLQGIADALKEYGDEPVVEKEFDMEKAVEEIDHSSVMLAYARIWKNRKHLTRQQMKTLKGQIKAGDTDAAMRGLDKLLKEAK